jgi:hypothetical protein
MLVQVIAISCLDYWNSFSQIPSILLSTLNCNYSNTLLKSARSWHSFAQKLQWFLPHTIWFIQKWTLRQTLGVRDVY